LGLNERVLVVELGNSLQNFSLLETEVFTSTDSNDAKLRFQPSTIQVKTLHYRIIRLHKPNQQSNSSFDLALLSMFYGLDHKLDFKWTVFGWFSPLIISTSTYNLVSFDVVLRLSEPLLHLESTSCYFALKM
jgi:hypothetical protein